MRIELFLLLVLPLVGIVVPLLAGRCSRTICAFFTALAPAAALGLLLSMSNELLDGVVLSAAVPWIPAMGLDLSIRLDGLAFLFLLLILGIGILVILYARYYLSPNDSIGLFYSYFMMFMTAMVGVVASGNIIQLWFFWELTSISSFLLISFWSSNTEARKGARMALTVTGAGGLALLAGLLLVRKVVGSFDLQTVLYSGDTLRESA